MTDWCKTGSASKPTYAFQLLVNFRQSLRWKQCKVIGYIVAALVGLVAYYMYLNSLYIMDEIYDLQGPKELHLSEKFIIRTYESNSFADISKFILHYSICPIVHEIQVFSRKTEFPHEESFKFSTAHSKVRFHTIHNDSAYEDFFQSNGIETEGIMTLDLDTYVSCSDLYFTHSVWKSSKDAALGYFPRLINLNSQPHSVRFTYAPPSAVFYQQSYSVLHPAALMVKKSYWKDLHASSDGKKFSAQNPECARWLLPLWVLKNSNSSSIWVEASVEIDSSISVDNYPMVGNTPANSNSLRNERHRIEENSMCISKISDLFHMSAFPSTYSKASKAKYHLTW